MTELEEGFLKKRIKKEKVLKDWKFSGICTGMFTFLIDTNFLLFFSIPTFCQYSVKIDPNYKNQSIPIQKNILSTKVYSFIISAYVYN
jgi:hypothetical protein